MFSENEIVMHCRECKGHCDRIKKCPLKIEWQNNQQSTIFPEIPANWIFSTPDQCLSMRVSDKYTTEELITGLGMLNGKLKPSL